MKKTLLFIMSFIPYALIGITTSLHHAAQQANHPSIELLLLFLPKDAQDLEGKTALHYCALNNDYTGCEMLLRAGADSTIPDNAGYTPLRYAFKKGYTSIANLIRSYRTN